MLESAPRRLSLLYQLYLTNQAARNLMRLSMAGTGMSGEEYALHSYLFANGPRTLSQAARDIGVPITTLATLMAPAIEAGLVERLRHPHDGRARLLRLTDAGRARLQAAIPSFSDGYRFVLAELQEQGAESEALYAALEHLRRAIEGAAAQLTTERATAEG